MNEETKTAAAPSTAETGHRRPRAALVRLAVVCTSLIFIASAGLLVFRGTTVDVPDEVLITRASPAWDGTVARVDGDMVKPYDVIFEKHTKYTISFHLPPGRYTLTVLKDNRAIYVRKDIELSRRARTEVVYLPATPEGLEAATQPEIPFLIDPSLPRTIPMRTESFDGEH